MLYPAELRGRIPRVIDNLRRAGNPSQLNVPIPFGAFRPNGNGLAGRRLNLQTSPLLDLTDRARPVAVATNFF